MLKIKPKFGILLSLVLIIIVILFGCDDNPNNPNDINNPNNPNNTIANWLVKSSKSYIVIDGVVGAVSGQSDYNWIRYTNDRNHEYEINSSVDYNTIQITENISYIYTQTLTGFQNSTTRYNMNGNINNYIQNSISDITTTVSLEYLSDALRDYNQYSINRVVQETDANYIYNYNAETRLISGLSMNTSIKRTQNNDAPTFTSSNTEYTCAIDLLDNSNNVKSYKYYINWYIQNGNELDLSTQGYTIYKINNNGITLETISYNAAGNISSSTINSNINNGIALKTTTYNAEGNITTVVERVFPTNNTIRTRLPTYTLSTTTYYNNSNITSQTVDVLSETSTAFVIRLQTYTNGILTGQTDTEYNRR